MRSSKKDKQLQSELSKRSKQLNPNNDEYWKSRNMKKRPEDWVNRINVQSSKKTKMTKKMTTSAAARIQSATSKSSGGKVSKGSFASRAQSAASTKGCKQK